MLQVPKHLSADEEFSIIVTSGDAEVEILDHTLAGGLTVVQDHEVHLEPGDVRFPGHGVNAFQSLVLFLVFVVTGDREEARTASVIPSLVQPFGFLVAVEDVDVFWWQVQQVVSNRPACNHRTLGELFQDVIPKIGTIHHRWCYGPHLDFDGAVKIIGDHLVDFVRPVGHDKAPHCSAIASAIPE